MAKRGTNKSSLRDALTQVMPSTDTSAVQRVTKAAPAATSPPPVSEGRVKKGWEENKCSLYLPHPAVYQALLDLAHEDSKQIGRRKKLNDLFLEGIELLLKKRGLPSIDELIVKAGE